MTSVLPMTPQSCDALPMGAVSCHVCGGQFVSLYRHLWKHGTTAKEYRARFPGAATSCLEVRVRQVRGGHEGAARSRSKPRFRITRAVPGSDPRSPYQQDTATAAGVAGVPPSVQGGGAQRAAG